MPTGACSTALRNSESSCRECAGASSGSVRAGSSAVSLAALATFIAALGLSDPGTSGMTRYSWERELGCASPWQVHGKPTLAWQPRDKTMGFQHPTPPGTADYVTSPEGAPMSPRRQCERVRAAHAAMAGCGCVPRPGSPVELLIYHNIHYAK